MNGRLPASCVILFCSISAISCWNRCALSDDIYFSTDDPQPYYGQIWRANIDGSGPQMIHRREAEFGIAELEFSPFDRKIYWSEHYGGLWRSERDGASPTRLFSSNANLDVHGIAFNGIYIYWADHYSGIWQGLLFSSPTAEAIFATGLSEDLAVHPTSGKLYWTQPSNCGVGCPTGVISGEPYGSTRNVIANLSAPGYVTHDVWVDSARGKLYWSDNGLFRSNLDGSAAELVIPDLVNAFAFSRSGDAVFYSVGPSLFRADRNGQNATLLLTAGLNIEQITIDASAVVPEPTAWALFAIASANVCLRRSRTGGAKAALLRRQLPPARDFRRAIREYLVCLKHAVATPHRRCRIGDPCNRGCTRGNDRSRLGS